MSISLRDFVVASEGQCLNPHNDPWGCQCVGLADAWANNLGHPLPLVIVAMDFIGTSPPGWRWIANSPSNAPELGDLVVWDSRIGPAGHIDLCIGPVNTATFGGLDQNWFNSNAVTGSPAAVVVHSYYGVAGWLHPRGGTPTPMPSTPFYVTVKPGAHWYDQPDHDTGVAANFTPGTVLKVVQVANDGTTDWYRPDIGTWWLDNLDCTVVPAPPAPAPPPPTTDLEARVAHLEARLAAMTAGLNT